MGPLIATLGLLLLVLTGVPVGFALAIIGIIGLSTITGLDATLANLPSTFIGALGDYDLFAIPLFTLMGLALFKAGVGSQIFDAAHNWIGHIRGGLAIAAVAGAAIFSAVSGSGIATAITMGVIAVPEMRKHGYASSLAGGAVASAGTLGGLIPPSITFIIYGVLVNESIGDLFIAGIIPGLFLTVAFSVMIYLRVRANPALAPPTPESSWPERFKSLLGLIPVITIFVVVVGGIYLGLFTPVEAGAIGAISSIIVGYAQRRMTLRKLWEAALESTQSSANILFIIAGGAVFAVYLTATRLPYTLATRIGEWDAPVLLVLLLIAVLYVIGGMFMEILPLIIITVPVFAPVVTNLGLDLVWFGVFIVLLGMIGMVSPPVGINLFALRSVTDVTLSEVTRGSLPFIFVMSGSVALWTVYGVVTMPT